ncbi:uncharacterized protein B0T15DRAFT_152532 [Chaetomium strumarium]|uniref:Uncharacterized protein n=1 Tax=Chaetomium strumarium TaxID=1170767 RepID=A0AAJ0GVT5_9PEZI|nr:hypothetical protein B0T15DRAFT_152532 [Chaetomium strumarium]
MDWDDSDDDLVRPFEYRDQEEQAEAWCNHPAQVQNKQLLAENLRLKKLLRENGISWDPRLTLDPNDRTRGTWSSPSPPSKRMRTRSSTGPGRLAHEGRRLPTLPMEIQLFILEYAMTSRFPIIDPLCTLSKDNITAEERRRGTQLAIGFLATCRAHFVEGTRFLWRNNTFIFTSHIALRNFANLSLKHRMAIKQITLRIIARYYDDEERKHFAPFPSPGYAYDSPITLKVIKRTREKNLARKGFRSYTWDQVVDFLDALRPPFDPNHPKGQPRPRLLPNLERLRMDFVNFPDEFLTPPRGTALHDLAAHDLGCTLNEIQLTGLPECHWGQEMGSHLCGMVKDDGVRLDSDPVFVYCRNQLRPLAGRKRWDSLWYPRVIRAWKFLADEHARTKDKPASPQRPRGHRDGHAGSYRMPPAPAEEGHPVSQWKRRRTIWKRVPMSQESGERIWNEFDRLTGLPIDNDNYDSDEDEYDISEFICPGCGIMHGPPGDH